MSTRAEAVLRVSGARKRFGERVALDGLDLELRPGEWLALLGPNGAGKTTLVRAIAGRVRLEGGTVELFGARLDGSTRDRALRRRLGVVPQDFALHPSLTARENLEVFGAQAGVARRERAGRIARALEWTGLLGREREPVRGFSGGMKRRLNLACSVLHEPELVILDEPTAGVDPQSRHRIHEMLEELRRQGSSIVLTTHQLDEAQQLADRIVIVDRGRRVADGSFEELLRATVGAGRRLRVECELAIGEPPPGFERAGGDNVLVRVILDLETELPRSLAELREAGLSVRDLALEAPSLQAVFLHLTGRELRE
jgi:ABC-2 type transport system ATP-binding protein